MGQGQSKGQGQGLQPTGSLASHFGVTNYRNNAAIKKADALFSNPAFNPGPGNKPKINASKLGNFAKGLATNVVEKGPNGKPKIKVPNNATMKKKTLEFASIFGFKPEPEQPPVRDLFGNPVNTTAPGYLGPAPGQQLLEFGKSGHHIGLTRGGNKKRRMTRRSRGI
jgi:hypothetical protein